MSLLLANGATATNAVPTLATDGFSLQGNSPGPGTYYWLKAWDQGVIIAKGAGTGALTLQGVVYVYSVLAGVWMPLGISSTIANRGMLNDGTTLTGTTTLAHTQPIQGLSAFDRIYLQLPTLTGTGMAGTAYLIPRYQN